MLYTVEETAIQLNVSKQSIYVKLKFKEYKDKILMKQGKTMITEELFKLIQDNLKVKNNVNAESQKVIEEPEDAHDIVLDEDLVNMNKELIKTLIEQLKIKDIQIDGKDNQIHELHKLLENSQVLLKEKPKQSILELEEHFQDLDTKLEEVKENMIRRKEQQDHPKSFLGRMFNKK